MMRKLKMMLMQELKLIALKKDAKNVKKAVFKRRTRNPENN